MHWLATDRCRRHREAAADADPGSEFLSCVPSAAKRRRAAILLPVSLPESQLRRQAGLAHLFEPCVRGGAILADVSRASRSQGPDIRPAPLEARPGRDRTGMLGLCRIARWRCG